MTDRNSYYGFQDICGDLTKALDVTVPASSVDDELTASSNEDELIAGAMPLTRLNKKPALTPVPRPHNAVALARSAFANANLPVMNVYAKTRKLEVSGH